jgi:MFS family permease
MGLGLGFAFLPLFGVVAKHFTKRRSLAMGILTTGTSLGGFAFSVLVNKLFHTSLGFAWTVRVSAFVVLGCLVLGNLLICEPKPSSASSREKPSSLQEASPGVATPEQPEEDKPRGIPELLRDPAYLAIIGSGFIVCLGLYFPM